MERGSGGDDRKVGVVGAGELGRSGIVASTDQLTSSHCAALVGGDVRMNRKRGRYSFDLHILYIYLTSST